MKNSQKGSVVVLLIILILVAVIGIGAYIYYQNQPSKTVAVSPSQTTTNSEFPTSAQNITPTSSVQQNIVPVSSGQTTNNQKNGWQTYINKQYGFSIEYPRDFSMSSAYPSASVYSGTQVMWFIPNQDYFPSVYAAGKLRSTGSGSILINATEDLSACPGNIESPNPHKETIIEGDVGSITKITGLGGGAGMSQMENETDYYIEHNNTCYRIIYLSGYIDVGEDYGVTTAQVQALNQQTEQAYNTAPNLDSTVDHFVSTFTFTQ